MNAMFVDILKKLTAEQGKEALLNPAKCKALLADYTKGEYKKESRLLLQAIDAGVSKAIDTTGELELCKRQQIKVLHEEYGMDQEIAANVVDMLALVLRGEQETETSHVCSNCGKELQKEWKSCPYCSTPVAKTNQAAGSAISSGSGGGGYGVSLIDSDDDIIRACTEEIKSCPNLPEAYEMRGSAYFNKAQYDMAIRDYTEAIKLNPNKEDYYIGRGDAYKEDGEYDMAIKDYTEAIRLNPRNVNGYMKRAVCYFDKGCDCDEDDEDEAEKVCKDCNEAAFRDYTEAIRLDPKKADAYIGRGDLYKIEDKFDMAIKDYTEALRLDPNDSFGYWKRGDTYFYKAQYDMAIKDYTECIRLNPSNYFVYRFRGDAYRNIAQYDLAIRNYTDAIRLKPDYTDAYCWRGKSYRQLGQISQAIQDYETALSLNPNIDRVQRWLRNIKDLQLPVVDGQILKTSQFVRAKGIFSFEDGNLFLCKDRLEWKGNKDNIVIPIEKISSVKFYSETSKNSGFTIKLDDNSKYHFITLTEYIHDNEESKQEMESWISAINDVRNGILG